VTAPSVLLSHLSLTTIHLPQFVLKSVDRVECIGSSQYMAISATLVRRAEHCASERPEYKTEYLTGSSLRKRWYQQLQYRRKMLVPVKDQFSTSRFGVMAVNADRVV
jgi:hypothetical protein